MPLWLQNIFVLAIAAIALVFIARQFYAALLGRRSKIGSCCAKGCEPAANAPATRTAFIPSDMLVRRK